MKRKMFDYTHEEMLQLLINKKQENGDNNAPIAPYTEKEIVEFEQHIGDTLPIDFRDYLLNVSREMWLDSYSHVVDLLRNGKCSLCNSADLSVPCLNAKSNIPLNMNSWIHYFRPKMKDGKVVHEDKPRRPKCNICKEEYNFSCKKCGINSNGMIEIADGGCHNIYSIIISGESKGTIWYEWDEYTQKIADSFAEYCNKNL